jgi:hypothetical protein
MSGLGSDMSGPRSDMSSLGAGYVRSLEISCSGKVDQEPRRCI